MSIKGSFTLDMPQYISLLIQSEVARSAVGFLMACLLLEHRDLEAMWWNYLLIPRQNNSVGQDCRSLEEPPASPMQWPWCRKTRVTWVVFHLGPSHLRPSWATLCPPSGIIGHPLPQALCREQAFGVNIWWDGLSLRNDKSRVTQLPLTWYCWIKLDHPFDPMLNGAERNSVLKWMGTQLPSSIYPFVTLDPIKNLIQ